MLKSRVFWLLIGWLLLSGLGTWWVATEGDVPVANAALVGVVAASLITVLLARGRG